MKAEKIEFIQGKSEVLFSIKFEDFPCHMLIPVADGMKVALQIIETYNRSFAHPIKVKRKVGRPRKK